MVSISQINSNQIKNTNTLNNLKFKNSILQNNVLALQGSTPDALLANFINMLGKSNSYMVSFGAGQEWARPGWAFNDFMVKVPRDGTDMRMDTKEHIQFEAANRITNYYNWPQIDTVNAWMVSAETQNFMPIGGLAQVAVDLPNSFNKKYAGKPDKMTIVTPMYVDGVTNKIELLEGGKRIKYDAKNASITLDKVMDLNVDMFDEWSYGGEMKTRKVGVYKGVMDNNTPYIMFYDSEVFDVTPDKSTDKNIQKNANCSGCYVTNINGFDENIRFAFFSKCVYELAKALKTNPSSYDKAPNIMLMNDWHVGSLAPLMKYLSAAEAEKGEISSSAAKYFQTTPTLFIAHNLGYQGAIAKSDENEAIRTKTLSTLFGKFTKNIIENSRNHEWLPSEDMNTMFKYDAVNAGMMGLSLTDRVVPVSLNYGAELLASSEFANGTQNLLNLRNLHNTFAPITNGYSKDLVAPTKANFDSWLAQVSKDLSMGTDIKIKTDDINLQPYTIKNMEKVKKENKEQVFKLLNRIIDRERQCPEANWNSLDIADSKRRYMLYKPNETDLSDIKDPTKVPVMTFVGRVADQKGMDTNFRKAILDFAHAFKEDQKLPKERQRYKDWDFPVIVIGGTVAELSSYKSLEGLKNELRAIDPKFGNRLLLFKGYANTNLLAAGTDFFLIPSNFEPCGLIQMEVMAKGVLPIASATGGLVSTIRDEKDGFLSSAFYDKKDADNPFEENHGKIVYVGANNKNIPSTNWKGFEDAMEKALHTYFKLPNQLVSMQKTAMLKDFSWDAPGGPLDKYITLMKTGKFTIDDSSFYGKADKPNKNPFPDDDTIKIEKKPKKQPTPSPYRLVDIQGEGFRIPKKYLNRDKSCTKGTSNTPPIEDKNRLTYTL